MSFISVWYKWYWWYWYCWTRLELSTHNL